MKRGSGRLIRLFLAGVLALGLAPLPAFGQQPDASGDAAVGAAQTPAGGISFVYLDEEAPEPGGVQSVVVAFADEDAGFASAVLRGSLPDGTPFSVACNRQAEGAALFTLEGLEAGLYTLEAVELAGEGGAALGSQQLVSEEGQPYSFAVAPSADGAFDQDGATAEDVLTYASDGFGDVAAVSSTLLDGTDGIAQAVEEAACAAASAEPSFEAGIMTLSGGDSSALGRASAGTREVVVAIDPGHGGSEPGAVASGLREADLTWEIAQACVARLKELGIKTYVTRAKNECPGLTERVERAVDAGASAFVSIHLNSATASSANGAEVWYPNKSSYRYDIHEQGLELSTAILKKLTALGLTNRGAKVKDATAEDGDEPETYPDNGGVADYYTVINEARRNNIVGIIVEHCFITNNAEALRLRDPQFVKSLGVADAEGIAQSVENGVISPALPKPGENDGSNPKDQWEKRGSTWYRFGPDGKLVVGWADIGGARYHFGEDGAMDTGWRQIDGGWYWFEEWGGMATGWTWVGDRCFYLDPETGRMLSSRNAVVEGTYYAFDASGAWIDGEDGWQYGSGGWYWLEDGTVRTGWLSLWGNWYWLDSQTGVMASGWKQVGGAWYWMDASGAMETGWLHLGSTWYHLAASGAMDEGWLRLNGAWYYLNPGSGAMAEGWRQMGGARYYLNPGSGAMAEGWKLVGGTWYYLDPGSGAMAEGWKRVNGAWYYLNPGSGAMATGWKRVGGTWYLLDGSGAMESGWQHVGGSWYLLGDEGDGSMRTGWQYRDGNWYLLGDAGDGAMKTGWQKVNGKWYLLGEAHDGAMKTGWQKVGSTWYLLGGPGDGAMRIGWQNVAGEWYYLDASGAMATGSRTINGVVRNFGGNGACQNPPAEPALEPLPEEVQDPQPEESLLTIMGPPTASVDQMVQAYMRTNAAYPAEALSRGGAPTVRDFCQIVYDEAVAEGVRPEVVYCQVMHETGNLKFGGDVKIEQYNFAGLGATGGGNPGNSFKDVRTGIRAQVQHLKCYACAEPLNQEKVDPRWWDALRGTAVYVQHLGIQENPNTVRNEDGTIATGRGWATAKNYGYTLANSIKLYFGVE